MIRGDDDRVKPLYPLPAKHVLAGNGDTVTYYQPRGIITVIKLHTRQAATGSKLYAIRSLQRACAVMTGEGGRGILPKDGTTWHIFRLPDRHLVEVHRAVVGIAEGNHLHAVVYTDHVDSLLEAALEELRARDAA